ncbi:hypothetical protein LAZ67_23000532, partial [Cordylochernes scorpioides]
MEDLIRRIVREEVHRALNPESTTPEPSSPKEIIREEIEKNVVAISKPIQRPPPRQSYPNQTRTFNQVPRRQYPTQTPIYNQTPPQRRTDEWRTHDNIPICFNCGRPGHVKRYCRERRQWTQRPEGHASSTQEPQMGSSFSVISDGLRRQLKKTMFKDSGMTLKVADGKNVTSIGRCTISLSINGLEQPLEFIVLPNSNASIILGWDFLEASNAVIDCGRAEIRLEEAKDVLNSPASMGKVVASRSVVIPAESTKLINVRQNQVLFEPSKKVLIGKGLTLPCALFRLSHNKGKLWIVNSSTTAQIVPKGMCLGKIQRVEENNLTAISECSEFNKEANNANHASHADKSDFKFLQNLISDDLSEEQQSQILSISKRYDKIFDKNNEPVKQTSVTKHKIETGNHQPIKHRPYRVSPTERQAIQTEVDKMLDAEIIRHSESPCRATPQLKKVPFRNQTNKSGHLVDSKGIYPDPEKIEAIAKFPTPNSITDARSFIGLCSYYRRFMENFAEKAAPLHEVLKKDNKFTWNSDQQDAFDSLKKALMSEPVLAYFEEQLPTELHTDASGYGIGAVLVQLNDGKERPVGYASRTLSKAEKNYSTTERECLAAIWAINKFRPYLFGREFVIVTDHHALCWLSNLKDPTGRLARWALKLQEYNVTVVYKSGRKHQDADFLSRNPLQLESEEAYNDEDDDIPSITALTCFEAEKRKDPKISKLIEETERFGAESKGYEMLKGTLYKKNFDPLGNQHLLVIPKHLRLELLKSLHDAPTAGHLGFSKTYERVKNKYFWPGLLRDIRKYVAHCKECQRKKQSTQKPPGLLKAIPPATSPFQRVGMDLLGRFPKSDTGNKWIIVCTDYLTRFAVTKALPTGEAKEAAKFLMEDVVLKHGAPREIITDRGRVFQSKLIAELTNQCSSIHRFTTAYHPQTNGLTERLNKTLANMIAMYVSVEQKDWDVILPYVTFAYNTAKQDTTGFTPFKLIHGREVETAVDTLFPNPHEDLQEDYSQKIASRVEETRQLARLETLKAQEKDKARYDSKHEAMDYNVGDLVWIFIPIRKVGLSEKLMKRYFGPYRVTRKLSDVTFEVEPVDQPTRRRQTRDLVHVLRMKPYHDPEDQADLFKASIEAEDGEYVIEENNRMTQTNGLRLARSLLTVTDKKTHIWITNPYPRPLKIMKDQTLAYGSLPAEGNFIENIEKQNENDEIQFQINKNVSFKGQERLQQILAKYTDLFSPRLGRTNLAKHQIHTEDAKPIKHKPYRVSAKERTIIKDQIDEMLEEGIIRPSSSPWSFPVILVKTRDGKYRFCVDYRKLNEVTVKDVYPIPRIDDVMDTLQGSKYFSAIDLKSGYWQVEIEERDKEKTAFTTAHGLYEFNIMPFGLCNAPATFERNMDNVLGNLRWQICLCYLDDVIIYSSDFPTHIKRLEAVLRCFSESNLKLNAKKCRFAFEELEILGHITNQEGIKPAEYNIKAVRDFHHPKKAKEVQSFLEMCSYYRKSIKDFSLIADPLTSLIRKNVQFIWLGKQEEAFQNLKKALINPPILGHFDPNASTCIHTDASNISLGATLIQNIGGEEKCHLCQSRKGSNQLPSGLLQPIPPANYPFERIGIDFVGPLPSTKRRRKWIIVLTDYYTKASIEAEDGEYVIEENNRMTQTNGLRLARSLLTVTDKKTHIWITNPYPRPLKIMKDQTLAYGSLPVEGNFIENIEKQNENDEIQFQINKNVSFKGQERLQQILAKYTDLFSPRLGRTNLAKHQIHTEDAKPIKHKPYRVSAKERTIIKDQIDEMLEEGIIRPSSSPWSFPVILVKTRDGKYRFCVDYRKLNEVTVKDVYPIPRIDDVMDTLQGSKYFSAIDLKSGYWQVEIEERDKEKTAFTTAHGLYEFNIMPFGLCNAPATFERNMDNVLGNLRWQICLCYLDDVIIYSSDFPTHIKRLEAVLRCFSESNLKLNAKKCRFAFEELEILGHITNQEGIKPAEYNIKAVRDFHHPKKAKEVQSFLEMCSYYRKSIKDFSLIADPLTSLIRKNVQFIWLGKQEEAFQNLKKALINPPILGHFDPNASTCIHTDASNISLGATLIQNIGGEEKCHLCQSRKGSNQLPSGLLQPIPPANYPFERIGIDFVGPLPSTKRRRKWIIVLTDYYTKASIEAEDGEYVIEENNRMTQTNGLRLARSLLTVTDKKTHIWITNPYPRPLKIMKDQTLAYGSLPVEGNFIENIEKQNENDEIQFQINKNVSFKGQERLQQILAKYTDLFSPRLGRTNLAKHQIHTEDAKPIKHKPYRVSAKERTIIKDQIDEMLEEGIIRPSSSPWSFPVILVKTRDGKYRFCVDYRKLNEVTVKDVYPIPRIDDVMDTLQGSKYFSAIDLKSGYWQVEIEERDKEKTAFTTAHGLYEFNIMPFGLCNAPATFERNMDNVLGNLRWQICLCYLDDVIIYSSDFPTHIKRLEAVLRCFSESNLKLNAKKCRFAFEELEILGHITNQEGIKPAEYNIKAVRDFHHPKKAKEVQSFLEMCSYYRKSIKDFSLIADPLTSLIRKNVQFIWLGKQEEAFQNLKKALINPPILGHFDPNASTCIHTDASNISLGATLIQNIGGEEKVQQSRSCGRWDGQKEARWQQEGSNGSIASMSDFIRTDVLDLRRAYDHVVPKFPLLCRPLAQNGPVLCVAFLKRRTSERSPGSHSTEDLE